MSGALKLSELKKKRKQSIYVNAARRKVETQSRYVRAIKAELNQARDKLKDITTRLKKALKEDARLKTMPPSIAVRDVTLDSIATCLKMTLLSLLLYLMNEYFGICAWNLVPSLRSSCGCRYGSLIHRQQSAIS